METRGGVSGSRVLASRGEMTLILGFILIELYLGGEGKTWMIADDDILFEESRIEAERDSRPEGLAAAGLSHQVGQLPVLRPPVTCNAGCTLRDAIATMQAEQIGYVVVVQDGTLVGMLTERDILNKVAAHDVDIDTQLVDEFMVANPEVLRPHFDIAYAINQMSAGGYRHIAIVDDNDRPVNVVSARNIVEYLAELFPKDVLNLPPDPDQAPSTSEGG